MKTTTTRRPAKGESATTHNALRLRQQVELAKFIESEIEHQVMSHADIAAKASAHFGYSITQWNVSYVRKGFGLPCPRQKPQRRNSKNQDRARVLAMLLRDLYWDLGKPVPDSLQLLCAGKSGGLQLN